MSEISRPEILRIAAFAKFFTFRGKFTYSDLIFERENNFDILKSQ